MNSFELNKVLGAVLGTCLFLVAMHIASGAAFTPAVPAKPGYVIEVKEEQPGKGAAAAAQQRCPPRAACTITVQTRHRVPSAVAPYRLLAACDTFG